MENIGHYRTAPLSAALSATDMVSPLAAAEIRDAPEVSAVRHDEASVVSPTRAIEPFSPRICVAIIISITAALWAIIISLVLAVLP